MISQIADSDLRELVGLGRRAHAESYYREYPFSEEKVREIFRPEAGKLAVKCRLGRDIAGFLVGTISSMEFSSKLIGMESSFYVRPESRGTRCGVLLVKAFLDWCEGLNIPAFVSIHYGEENGQAYRFMERMGMTERGRIFMKGN